MVTLHGYKVFNAIKKETLRITLYKRNLKVSFSKNQVLNLSFYPTKAENLKVADSEH